MGIGRGNWYRWQGRKTTVEECRSLDANRWMREGILVAGAFRIGSWVWRDRDTAEVRSAIDYEVRADEDGTGWVRLRYTMTQSREELDYRISLETTRPHLGGLRWWFTCPLADRWGRGCYRRCAKLYLGGRYFGCRRCHDLTYRSSQEAHQDARSALMIDKMAARMGLLDPAKMRAGELLGLWRATERLRP